MHEAEIDGLILREGDMIIDRTDTVWRGVACLSASGENTVAFQTFGKAELVYYPARPLRRLEDLHDRLIAEVTAHVAAQTRMIRHSVFAHPHFWLWHALFDGTWLCRCWHSREMKNVR